MDKNIKFTIGGFFGGYNTIEIFIDGEKVSHKVTHSLDDEEGFKSPAPPTKNLNVKAWLAELDALNIFSWEESYYNPDVLDGEQWSLTFKDGKKIYEGGGSNAYPPNWIRFLKWINELCEDFKPVTEMKFTVGNVDEGYKTVEIFATGGADSRAAYKILRSGLLGLDKKFSDDVKISDEWFDELNALKIFEWEKNYSSNSAGGVQWELTFKRGENFYRGQGSNAYPEDWENFLDWLDELIPELEFVNRGRLEKISLTHSTESLTLDRREKTLTLDKKNSRHIYNLGEEIKKLFDGAQKFLDGLEPEASEVKIGAQINFEIVRHDGSTETVETFCNENFLPGLTNLLEEIHSCAADLTAEIFSPTSAADTNRQGKYIFCKVQFKGSYKHYTYRTDDETLAVGDEVDVPVGKNNDVAQARIVEIGYFDEYEAPFPVDRIKTVIGKHVELEWENY